MKEYLFVYGTLKRSILNLIKDREGMEELYQLYVKNTKYIANATINGKLYFVEDGQEKYPAAILSDNSQDVIHGEILEFDSSILPTMDEYEGINDSPQLYQRIKKDIRLTNGESIDAWVYIYNLPVSGFRQIESGVFQLTD